MKIDYSEVGNIGSSNAWNSNFTKFTYFWGEYPFSQWSKSHFKVDDVEYNCNEQWMMASKARLFKDEVSLKAIMKSEEPSIQKKLGKGVKNFDQSAWNTLARELVKQGQIEKFKQDKIAFKELMKTTGTLLVEASPYDRIWGIGISAADAKRNVLWKGTNWLGEVLTKVRLEFEAK